MKTWCSQVGHIFSQCPGCGRGAFKNTQADTGWGVAHLQCREGNKQNRYATKVMHYVAHVAEGLAHVLSVQLCSELECVCVGTLGRGLLGGWVEVKSGTRH